MEEEVASLLALSNSFKKTCKSATFILSIMGVEVTAKLEVKLINAKSSSSIKAPPSTLLTHLDARLQEIVKDLTDQLQGE